MKFLIIGLTFLYSTAGFSKINEDIAEITSNKEVIRNILKETNLKIKGLRYVMSGYTMDGPEYYDMELVDNTYMPTKKCILKITIGSESRIIKYDGTDLVCTSIKESVGYNVKETPIIEDIRDGGIGKKDSTPKLVKEKAYVEIQKKCNTLGGVLRAASTKYSKPRCSGKVASAPYFELKGHSCDVTVNATCLVIEQ